MKKFIYLFTIAFAATIFSACSDDDNVDEEWRDANIEAYNEITMNPNYVEVKGPEGSPKGVFKRVIKNGSGDVYPFQTSIVKIHYKGYYHNGVVFAAGTSITEVPASFEVNGVVRGFSTALQTMVVGDKWEVVIPYTLGYGVNDQTDYYGNVIIKAYSTLFYEVELVEIDLYPEK